MLILFIITPTLGFLRNYIKYKQCKLSLFLRTPIIYFLIMYFQLLLGCRNIIYKTLIYERWFFFIFKTYKSIINDDYHKKKEKYKIKYNLKYNDNDN
tara:strand:- start:2000 stop:2290 length:291 start_codon:yes stop_codon:yes gene_type:complete